MPSGARHRGGLADRNGAMRVLHVVADGDPGWAMTAALAVIDAVPPTRGIRHALVTETGSPLAAAARARGIPTATRAFQRARRFRSMRPRLVETIWELAPDVVHAHGIGAGHAVLPALSWLGLPMVLAMPAVAPPRATMLARLQRFLERRAVLGAANVLLFSTQAELAAAAAAGQVPARARGVVAPPPLDLEALPPRQGPEPVILLQGRLHADIAVDRVVGAMRGLPASLRLEVIADGAGRDPLAAGLAAAGLADRVDWIGRLPRNHALARLAVAAVLLDPREGSGVPLGLVEAAALGVPIIAAGRPALVEALGVTGVDPGAPAAAWAVRAAEVFGAGPRQQCDVVRQWLAPARGGEAQLAAWSASVAGNRNGSGVPGAAGGTEGSRPARWGEAAAELPHVVTSSTARP
jgi:glycosyltransferase involved in cell wall biosynthesis